MTSFLSLFALTIYEVKNSPAVLPGCFFYILWCAFSSECDVAFSLNFGDLAVVALSTFGNASDGFLDFSRYGVVSLSPAVPGSIQMSFEAADTFCDG